MYTHIIVTLIWFILIRLWHKSKCTEEFELYLHWITDDLCTGAFMQQQKSLIRPFYRTIWWAHIIVSWQCVSESLAPSIGEWTHDSLKCLCSDREQPSHCGPAVVTPEAVAMENGRESSVWERAILRFRWGRSTDQSQQTHQHLHQLHNHRAPVFTPICTVCLLLRQLVWYFKTSQIWEILLKVKSWVKKKWVMFVDSATMWPCMKHWTCWLKSWANLFVGHTHIFSTIFTLANLILSFLKGLTH